MFKLRCRCVVFIWCGILRRCDVILSFTRSTDIQMPVYKSLVFIFTDSFFFFLTRQNAYSTFVRIHFFRVRGKWQCDRKVRIRAHHRTENSQRSWHGTGECGKFSISVFFVCGAALMLMMMVVSTPVSHKWRPFWNFVRTGNFFSFRNRTNTRTQRTQTQNASNMFLSSVKNGAQKRNEMIN